MADRMFRFEELEVWKLAIEYADELYELSKEFPPEERYNLTDHLKRAVISISNNIAEGSGSATVKNFKSFLDISISSVLETVNLYILQKEEDMSPKRKDLNFIKKLKL